MRRFHGRRPRDWSLTFRRDDRYGFLTAAPLRYFLDMHVTPDEAQRLAEAVSGPDGAVYRGSPSFSYGLGSVVRVSEIEVTAAEAHRITRGGEDPYEVVVPECGYRLRAVPAEF